MGISCHAKILVLILCSFSKYCLRDLTLRRPTYRQLSSRWPRRSRLRKVFAFPPVVISIANGDDRSQIPPVTEASLPYHGHRTMSCKPSAEAFVQSYASAMHLAQTPDVTPTSCATALGAHYHPGMTAFTFGHKHCFETQADAVAGITSHLENFDRAGLGWDIRMEKSRVEEVSPSFYVGKKLL